MCVSLVNFALNLRRRLPHTHIHLRLSLRAGHLLRDIWGILYVPFMFLSNVLYPFLSKLCFACLFTSGSTFSWFPSGCYTFCYFLFSASRVYIHHHLSLSFLYIRFVYCFCYELVPKILFFHCSNSITIVFFSSSSLPNGFICSPAHLVRLVRAAFLHFPISYYVSCTLVPLPSYF